MSVSQGKRAALEAEDVVKRYGERIALAGVTLQVRAGEVLGLLGPNGAGKSTFVAIVSALRTPDRGRVFVDGIDVARHPAVARRRVGLAPQETGLYEVLTVRENLAFFAELAGLRRVERRARVEACAVALRLEGLLDRPTQSLSGGERRRAHTAIAFLGRPSVLLLDEPTVGADIETRAALLDVVRRAADDGAAIVYSTHYLPEVAELDANVAILVEGRIIATGTVADLVTQHGHGAVELTFDGAAPAFEGAPDAEICREGSVLRVPAADPAACVAGVLQQLGPHAARLQSVELLRPNLDSVFLALTGRRYGAETNPDPSDVAAA